MEWDYTTAKIISFVVAGLLTILGEFVTYKKDGKITRWGITALVLILLAFGIGIYCYLEEQKSIEEDNRVQQDRYETNVNKLDSIAFDLLGVTNELNDLFSQNYEQSLTDSTRFSNNMDNLSFITNDLFQVRSDIQEQNTVGQERFQETRNKILTVLHDISAINYPITPVEIEVTIEYIPSKQKADELRDFLNLDFYDKKSGRINRKWRAKVYQVNSEELNALFTRENEIFRSTIVSEMFCSLNFYGNPDSVNSDYILNHPQNWDNPLKDNLNNIVGH